MFPLLGPLITAGAELIGGAIGSHGQSETNKANAALAQKQMDFQREMSSTAYQRATADMKAAGINPMLAYMQGGASSPQGTMATMENPEAALGRSVSDASSSAMQAMSLQKDLELKKYQVSTQKNLSDKAFSEAQAAGYETMFPDAVIGPKGETVGDTFWGQQRLASMAAARANAASALSTSRINTERLPWERFKSAPGRMWHGLGTMLLGGGAARPGTSAWQRWTEAPKRDNPQLHWRLR